ncbi:MAG TPA: hypothetical protein VF247_00910 [Candidatus Krumholzibacteria bacterium]
MSNTTRRRLGFVMMVLAVASSVYNLERPGHPATLGAPVIFLVVGAVLLRKTRSSTLD